MIFKLVKSKDDKRLRIYKTGNVLVGDFEYESQYDEIFGDKRKVFFSGKIDRHNKIKFLKREEDRNW